MTAGTGNSRLEGALKGKYRIPHTIFPSRLTDVIAATRYIGCNWLKWPQASATIIIEMTKMRAEFQRDSQEPPAGTGGRCEVARAHFRRATP
jgi:hypothetical protein